MRITGNLILYNKNNGKFLVEYRSTFTLIELLMVIAFIAILAGLLIPALAAARKRAKSIQCLSNLKQLGLIASMYTNSYNEYFPPAYYNAITDLYAWDTKSDGSPGIMYDSTGYSEIQQCPAFHGVSNSANDKYTGYNYNTSYIGSDNANPAQLKQIKHPADTALFGDGETRIAGVVGANKFMRAPHDNTVVSSKEGAQGFRHQKSTNVCWCDGHASSQKEKYTGGVLVYSGTGFLSDDDSKYDLN